MTGLRTPAHSLVLASIAWTLVAVSPALAVEDWTSFVAQAGDFSVDMPTPPELQQKEKWFPVSSFVSTVYKSIVGDDVFGVNHTDIPGFAKVFASDERVFQSSREGFIEDSQAVEVSYSRIEWLGRKARELIYEIPALDDRPLQHGRARMFFVGNRLYIFYAEVTDAVPDSDVEHFFDSVRLMAPDGR